MSAILCTIVLVVSGFVSPYQWTDGVSDTLVPCPGLYCGRVDNWLTSNISQTERFSECGPCPRGWRVFNPGQSALCEPCTKSPVLYDWLYLGFVVLFTLLSHWVAIDFTAKRDKFTKEVLILHSCALLEVVIAALVTLVMSHPVGQFTLHSCGVNKLSDWYTLLHNPFPNYEKVLYCTQEAVYPLYSIVFIFYGLCLLGLVLVRPWLASKFLPGRGRNATYSAFYFLPIFCLAHGVLGGIIYFSYPYIVILVSLVSCAAHYAFQLNQSVKSLVIRSLTDSRNLVILLGHWALHAYGILAVTELKKLTLHLSLLALVPVPTVFYVLTARFTDPARINSVNEPS